jgi:hypothetical protein
MRRTFVRLDHVLNLLEASSQSRVQGNGRNDKTLLRLGLAVGDKPLAEQLVHGSLEGFAGAPNLFLDLPRYIVVNGESGPHIMMLSSKTS